MTSRRPLDGIRVLDLTVWFQGPVCAQHLADFGAEVIHVERPGSGDPARGVRSIKALEIGDWNQYFLVINRNKRSMAVDLTREDGQALLHQLVAKSDVFLSNQGVENLAKWKLDYETLRAINPALVYATNTGHGLRGKVDKPSFDINVQALTGLMARQGEPGDPPVYLGMGSGDAYGGLLSALGIVLALLHRRSSGRGQAIDASLYGAQLFMAAPTLQPFLASGDPFFSRQRSRREARNPLWNRYPTGDGWVFLCAENTDANWEKLAATLGSAELAGDARFQGREGRARHAAELIDALDRALAARGAREWAERWRAAGLAAAPIQSFREVAEDEQAWANDYLLRTHCAEVGREVDVRGLPITLGRTPGRVESLGPELGQDTELILLETLGLDWDRIAELKEQGVIP